jgi:hypothetical protein
MSYGQNVKQSQIGGRSVSLHFIRVSRRQYGFATRVHGTFLDTGEAFAMWLNEFDKLAHKLDREAKQS